MLAILVNKYDRLHVKKINEYLKDNDIIDYKIYSLDKKDNSKKVAYLNINTKYYEILEVAFALLDKNEHMVAQSAYRASSIFGLGLDWFVRRLLLNDVFYNEARLLVAEKILFENCAAQKVFIFTSDLELFKHDNKENIIYCNDRLDMLRDIRMFFYFTLNALSNNELLPKKHEKCDIVCVAYPGYFKLIDQAVNIIREKRSVLLAIKNLYSPEASKVEVEGNYQYLSSRAKIGFSYVFFYIKIFIQINKLNNYSRVFKRRLIDIVSRMAKAIYIAEKLKPRLIIEKNEYEVFENLEYAVYKKYNVKYVHYMHGDKIFELPAAYIESDALLVWGKYYEDLLNKLRCKSKICIVGHQKIEKRIKSVERCNNENLLRIRNKYDQIVAVFMQTCCGPHDYESQRIIINEIVGAIKKAKSTFLIIKHHPLESRSQPLEYNKIIEPVVSNVLSVRNSEIDPYDILSIADLVITPSSVVGLEAILLEKLVLFVNLTGIPNLSVYPSYNLALEINNENEIAPLIAKLLSDVGNYRSKFDFNYAKQYWMNGLVGNSADLFYKEIEKVLNGQI